MRGLFVFEQIVIHIISIPGSLHRRLPYSSLVAATLHDLHHILTDAAVGVQRLPHRRQRNPLRLHHPGHIPEQPLRPPFTQTPVQDRKSLCDKRHFFVGL